ncbi:MAG: hypothetical protein ACOZF0_05790 [Thermodesulfobacteriota bacterium]
MSTREKVIVFCMMGVVIYGAVQFFGSSTRSPGLDAQGEVPGLDAFIVTMAGILNKQNPFEADYVLEKAVKPFAKDPFVTVNALPDKNAGPEKTAPSDYPMVYTGYVRVGDTMVAVINGTEYETGDMIEPGGYRVTRISPEQVELQAKTGEKKSVQLPNENP